MKKLLIAIIYFSSIHFGNAQDVTPPSIIERTRIQGATDVPLGQDFSVTFNENIILETDARIVFLRKDGQNWTEIYEGYNHIEVIDNVLHFSFSTFDPNTNYSIELSNIQDVASNEFSENNWSFTTSAADITPPSLSNSVPSDGGTYAPLSGAGTLSFNEGVKEGSGTLSLFLADDTPVETITTGADDDRISQSTSHRMAFNFDNDLEELTDYYIIISAGAFMDLNDNGNEQIRIDFTSNNRPSIISRTPSSNATGVAINTTIEFSLDENASVDGASVLSLKEYNSETTIETFDLAALDIGYEAGNFPANELVTLTLSNDLEQGTKYYLSLSPTASIRGINQSELIKDLENKDDWTFTTIDPIVNIPDENMKAALVGMSFVNTNDDTEIQVSEAEAVTGYIDLQSLGINEATGIEAFTNVYGFYLQDNNLTEIDLSGNTSLGSINLNDNSLSTLDVSNNTNLEFLYAENNWLTSVSGIDGLIELRQIDLDNNNLTQIAITNCTGLENIWLLGNQLSSIDFTGSNYDATNGGLLRVNGNAELTSIDISMLTNLKLFQAGETGLTSLDFTSNEQIESIAVNFNPNLESINTAGLTNLTTLYVRETALASLDVSTNTALETLELRETTTIKDLDLSNNTNLIHFQALYGDLYSLNIANGNNGIITSFDIRYNNNLNCVTVDDVTYSNENWTLKNSETSYSTDCGPVVDIPDSNLKTYLLDNSSINTNGDGEIQVSEAEAYDGAITINNQGVIDATGIEAFVNLTSLTLTGGSNGKLSSIDVRTLTQLEILSLGHNNLSEIDVTNNTKLTTLAIFFNTISTLDLSNNDLLESLYIRGNLFTSIDLSNLSNLYDLNIMDNDISSIDLSNNSLLTQITIDYNNISSIDLSNLDLMVQFFAEGNALTSIDFSQNPNLQEVSMSANDLTSIDFSNNPLMKWIYLNDNNLQSVNLKNGNNAIIEDLELLNNPNLSCVEVDDISHFETNVSLVLDEGASLSTSCNVSPTAISLSAQMINENNAVDEVVGILSTSDIDISDSHSYSLVSGDGDTDNTSFDISGQNLIAKEVFDFETKSSYTVRIETNDGNGGTFQQTFTIAVSDTNDAPFTISLSGNSIDENNSTGATIGSFSASDEDEADTHIYDLVEGTGDDDNASFSISDNNLIATEVFDFETKLSYSIRVSTMDEGGLSHEEVFTISINDLDEAPVLGLEDKFNISYYPNPVINTLNIETDQESVIRLIDLNGKVLIKKNMRYGSLDLSLLKAGTYLLEIKIENVIAQKRIIKGN